MLRTFSNSEFRDFEKFVDSPYFSQGRDLSKFFKILKPFYPNFEDSKFTIENLFSDLYPGKKYEEKSSGNLLHKLSSELYKLCREFLIHSELKKDDSRKYFYLLNQLRQKKLYDEFEKEYKNSESINENAIKGGVIDFLNQYFLKHSFLEYSIDKQEARNAFENILLTGEYLTAAALIKGFRNIDTNLSSEKFNVKVRYNLVDNFIKHLDSEMLLEEMKVNDDKFYPFAAISHGIHKMFENIDDIDNYFNLKKLILKYISLFGHTEKYILFQTMIGYCIKRIDGECRELFIREEFENYKITFELGIYKFNDQDKIQINNFRSIVGSAVDNNEIDWLENFVENYVSELHTEHQENMKHYSLAYIYFERRNFEKALECVMNVKYDFFLFKMDVKNLMFKIYFELGFYEQAYSMIDTMKHYISNTKDISEMFKERERNFIKFASKILKEKSYNKKKSLAFLKNEIINEKNLQSRNWLLQKVSY